MDWLDVCNWQGLTQASTSNQPDVLESEQNDFIGFEEEPDMFEGHFHEGQFILHMARKHIQINEVFDSNGELLDDYSNDASVCDSVPQSSKGRTVNLKEFQKSLYCATSSTVNFYSDKPVNAFDIIDNNNNVDTSNEPAEMRDFDAFFADPSYCVTMINEVPYSGDPILFVQCSSLTTRMRDVMYSSDNHVFGCQDKSKSSLIWECLGRTPDGKRCRVKFHPERDFDGRLFNHLKNYPHMHDDINVLVDQKKRLCSSLVKKESKKAF